MLIRLPSDAMFLCPFSDCLVAPDVGNVHGRLDPDDFRRQHWHRQLSAAGDTTLHFVVVEERGGRISQKASPMMFS